MFYKGAFKSLCIDVGKKDGPKILSVPPTTVAKQQGEVKGTQGAIETPKPTTTPSVGKKFGEHFCVAIVGTKPVKLESETTGKDATKVKLEELKLVARKKEVVTKVKRTPRKGLRSPCKAKRLMNKEGKELEKARKKVVRVQRPMEHCIGSDLHDRNPGCIVLGMSVVCDEFMIEG
eukprot:Gb_38523 [translate_table: standard]